MILLTEPENWSPHAVYQATRLFVSNLNARMAQRFLALVLLPHVRNDIHSNRRLHFALFLDVDRAIRTEGQRRAQRLLVLGASDRDRDDLASLEKIAK